MVHLQCCCSLLQSAVALGMFVHFISSKSFLFFVTVSVSFVITRPWFHPFQSFRFTYGSAGSTVDPNGLETSVCAQIPSGPRSMLSSWFTSLVCELSILRSSFRTQTLCEEHLQLQNPAVTPTFKETLSRLKNIHLNSCFHLLQLHLPLGWWLPNT